MCAMYGAAQGSVCPQCGSTKTGSLFCKNCGATLWQTVPFIPSQTVPLIPSQAPDSRQPPRKIGKLMVVGLFLCLLIDALIPDHMGTLQLRMDRVFFFAFFAAFIALFLRGSRPATTHPFATAIVALISLGVSILVIFSASSAWMHFDGRILDVMITLPLVIGALCGRRAFRATGARPPLRLAGLLAVIACVPFAFFFLLITFLNFCGGDYNPQ